MAERDIGHVLAACEIPDYGHDREALHALPVNFALDHRTGLTDPRGQIGKRPGGRHAPADGRRDAAPEHAALHPALRPGARPASSSSSYASGLASLVEDEQELGAACIDIGGGATGISIFVRRQMIYADCVRMGGVHVTSRHLPGAAGVRCRTPSG